MPGDAVATQGHGDRLVGFDQTVAGQGQGDGLAGLAGGEVESAGRQYAACKVCGIKAGRAPAHLVGATALLRVTV
jgi:hypothetical protein